MAKSTSIFWDVSSPLDDAGKKIHDKRQMKKMTSDSSGFKNYPSRKLPKNFATLCVANLV